MKVSTRFALSIEHRTHQSHSISMEAHLSRYTSLLRIFWAGFCVFHFSQPLEKRGFDFSSHLCSAPLTNISPRIETSQQFLDLTALESLGTRQGTILDDPVLSHDVLHDPQLPFYYFVILLLDGFEQPSYLYPLR